MHFNPEDFRFVVINWLRNLNTVQFLGIWEKIHNPNFNCAGFDTVKFQIISHGNALKYILSTGHDKLARQIYK